MRKSVKQFLDERVDLAPLIDAFEDLIENPEMYKTMIADEIGRLSFPIVSIGSAVTMETFRFYFPELFTQKARVIEAVGEMHVHHLIDRFIHTLYEILRLPSEYFFVEVIEIPLTGISVASYDTTRLPDGSFVKEDTTPLLEEIYERFSQKYNELKNILELLDKIYLHTDELNLKIPVLESEPDEDTLNIALQIQDRIDEMMLGMKGKDITVSGMCIHLDLLGISIGRVGLRGRRVYYSYGRNVAFFTSEVNEKTYPGFVAGELNEVAFAMKAAKYVERAELHSLLDKRGLIEAGGEVDAFDEIIVKSRRRLWKVPVIGKKNVPIVVGKRTKEELLDIVTEFHNEYTTLIEQGLEALPPNKQLRWGKILRYAEEKGYDPFNLDFDSLYKLLEELGYLSIEKPLVGLSKRYRLRGKFVCVLYFRRDVDISEALIELVRRVYKDYLVGG